MNVVGCSNARGNVIDTFNECKEYVTFETNCYVVTLALKHFNMKFSNSEEDVIPPTIRTSNKNKKQQWLHHQVTEMLKEHIIKIHAETIEEVHSFSALSLQLLSVMYALIWQKRHLVGNDLMTVSWQAQIMQHCCLLFTFNVISRWLLSYSLHPCPPRNINIETKNNYKIKTLQYTVCLRHTFCLRQKTKTAEVLIFSLLPTLQIFCYFRHMRILRRTKYGIKSLIAD